MDNEGVHDERFFRLRNESTIPQLASREPALPLTSAVRLGLTENQNDFMAAVPPCFFSGATHGGVAAHTF